VDPNNPEGRRGGERPDGECCRGGDEVQPARGRWVTVVVLQGKQVGGDDGARRADGETRDRPLPRNYSVGRRGRCCPAAGRRDTANGPGTRAETHPMEGPRSTARRTPS
jgi:hypothetical protein